MVAINRVPAGANAGLYVSAAQAIGMRVTTAVTMANLGRRCIGRRTVTALIESPLIGI